MTINVIPADWTPRRKRAAEWFIADITRNARMINDPAAVEVEVKIAPSGQLSVTAESRLYWAFGTCIIGPRGGINHRNDIKQINV